ncbi:MAG: RNA-directed DNA polymerase [Bacteroidetes bacterium]|nr:MAG: RNA-directed DNA polymerase [Bacteroidota bacterium]
MKKIGNIYGNICTLDNLRLADKKAQRGKSKQYGVGIHKKNAEANLLSLQHLLLSKTYKTSPYTTFIVNEGKEREVFRLPYFPDRICHHAIMNVLEPIFKSVFTADTYSCIRGKGIHNAFYTIRRALTDEPGTRYCLKLDIKKFYPSINHDVLKALLRHKFKDNDLLYLLDEIIDSAPGLPIGNYLSQYLANFYLCYFDHWLKEKKGVKYYFRYADDIVILADNKPYLHTLLADIRQYLTENLKLEVKSNYQVFPVASRSLDFIGYKFYHTHTLVRKSIKQNFARKLAKGANPQTIASYNGWLTHADCINLYNELMRKFSDLNIIIENKSFTGEKIAIKKILNKEISVVAYKIGGSKYTDKGTGKCLHLQITLNGDKRVVFTGSSTLMQQIEKVPADAFPFTTKIIENEDRYEFT